jgi:hypothetical protein
MEQHLLQPAPDFPVEEKLKAALITIPEIRVLTKIISGISWVNFLIGLPGAVLFPIMHNASLFATGWMAILSFLLLRLIVGHLGKTKSWNEVCVIAMCGIYFPAFIIYISGSQLIETILYGH